ncbi:MAG: DMT family transporter [Eubacteriales bacterium]|nr:DMT family transporter [Clostridiales bacterium]MDD7302569.1 DMT family transporter [Eubacteriales bacterium]MDY4434225.1 DMT family transporter [Candidatus Flemingibacterium sp.]
MLEYTYLLIILLLRLPQNLFNKRSSGIVKGAPAYFAYGAYRYLLSGGMALVLLLFAGGFSGVSLKALAISAIGAVALGSNLFFGLEALKSGAMVLASMAGSAGLLLPCVFGIFMFDEPMSLMQLFGILLLIFSGWLLIGYSKKLKGSFTPRTMLLLIGSMLSNGFTMVAQKMFSKYLPDVSVSVFSFLAFGLVGVGMCVGLVPQLTKKEKREEIKKLPKALWFYGAGLSTILLIINQLATIAARVIPSAIMFPINDGGATIITALTGAVVFKEKLTARSVAGLALGIASLIVINLF